jgi:hypothetical protein
MPSTRQQQLAHGRSATADALMEQFLLGQQLSSSSMPKILLCNLHDLPKPTSRDVAVANLGNCSAATTTTTEAAQQSTAAK